MIFRENYTKQDSSAGIKYDKTILVNKGPTRSDEELPRISRLRFVSEVNGRFEDIKDNLKYGEPFFVEASFTSIPKESQRIVELEWGEGKAKNTMKVPVDKKEDGKVFRSGPLYLEAPANAEIRGPGR